MKPVFKNLIALTFCTLFISANAQTGPGITPINGKNNICTIFPAQSQTFSASGSGNFIGYNWVVQPGALANVNPSGSVVAVTFLQPGINYTVYCNTFNSVSSSQTVNMVVNVNETPQVTFSGNNTFCQGSSTNVQASPTTLMASSTISYIWNPMTGVGSPFSGNTVLSPSVSTNYIIVFSIASCTNSATFTTNVVHCPLGLNANKATELAYVSPNPSQGEFKINNAEPDSRVTVIDGLGRTVSEVFVGINREAVIRGLAAGNYIVIVGNRRIKIIVTE